MTGETRLGLMWTCMTLYNRPYQCFTPELQPEWLLALICIFVGCICITTAIILLASSNWDRDVIPYARWVGFTASKFSFTLNQVCYVCVSQSDCPFMVTMLFVFIIHSVSVITMLMFINLDLILCHRNKVLSAHSRHCYLSADTHPPTVS